MFRALLVAVVVSAPLVAAEPLDRPDSLETLDTSEHLAYIARLEARIAMLEARLALLGDAKEAVPGRVLDSAQALVDELPSDLKPDRNDAWSPRRAAEATEWLGDRFSDVVLDLKIPDEASVGRLSSPSGERLMFPLVIWINGKSIETRVAAQFVGGRVKAIEDAKAGDRVRGLFDGMSLPIISNGGLSCRIYDCRLIKSEPKQQIDN